MIKTLIINKDLGSHKAGSKVKVKCNKDGIPLDVFWRRRLKDSAVDNCVEWGKKGKMMKNKVVENKSIKSEKGDKS